MLIVTTNRTRTTKAVGKTTRSILAERGIFSVEELANADIEQLIKIPGFGKSKATRMVRAAKYMIGESCRIGVVLLDAQVGLVVARDPISKAQSVV
ncbi:MAG: helix-hairpin-helix domain-containing protein [Gammaproteobacteria bacterium]|nr:helix-hairpin-helix domain-containing protein [Gammaproteobacteria bacterium]